jgi:integrase
MASIAKDTRGGVVQWRLFFRNKHGNKQTIRLGPVNKRDAQTILAKVRPLISASIAGGNPNEETARWLADIGDTLRRKLANAGLIQGEATPDDGTQDAAPVTLGDFLKAYIGGRADLKPNTARNYEVTRQHLVSHFGVDKVLQDITPGDADDWRQALIRKGLSAATISREVKRARQYFRAAVRRHVIDVNPFQDLKGGKQANPSREYFVTREAAQRVIDACPNREWRVLVALSRYGGLRCPSEHLALRLDDIDWERDRMTVRSPKTEHHEGGESRVVPIFPELMPYLREACERAEPGTEYVITRYRQRNANLRTQFERIIRRAGLEPWPKVFQNLRASRETELAAEYPIHVVCKWIGNSPAVAQAHYLQVTEADYQRAVETKTGDLDAAGGCNQWVTVDAKSGCNQWVTPVSAVSSDDTQTGRKPLFGKSLRPVSANRGNTLRVTQAPPRDAESLPFPCFSWLSC